MTGLDHLDYDQLQDWAKAHRLVRDACDAAGVKNPPAFGTARWRHAPPDQQLAGLATLALRYLVDNPHDIAADLLKDASCSLAEAMPNLGPTYAELTAARRVRAPLLADQPDPRNRAAVSASWQAGDHSREGGHP